jgi:undecaprenyl-diphosphatase
MLARTIKEKPLRIYVITAAILLALMVGFTRIYLGVHWSSDVLAGWCLGAAWSTVCWIIDRWLRARGTHPADEGG